LYEDDSIYDRFFLDMSPCGNYFMTGAYNKSAHVVDVNSNYNLSLPAHFEVRRGRGFG
jgi:hypothetical protein